MAHLADFLECADTLGRGHVQVDTNLAFTRDRAGDDTATLRATPTLLRIGVAERLDLRLETDGAVRERVREAGASAEARGRADISVGLKYAFAHTGPGGARMAVIAKVDMANGSRDVRGEGNRPKVKFIADWDLGEAPR